MFNQIDQIEKSSNYLKKDIPSEHKIKIIKRYQNRKLYDTERSSYVTLCDISMMIREKKEVKVIDNKTKKDITASTFSMIIFESEKKAAQYSPIETLKKIIKNGNGSFSGFLLKMNVFSEDQLINQAQLPIEPLEEKSSQISAKKTIAQIIANEARSNSQNSDEKNISENNSQTPLIEKDKTPTLPTSNRSHLFLV